MVRFTAVFTNSGQVPYTGITIASNVTDIVDDATPNGDRTATSGTLTLTTTGISWTGSIPVGGSVTVTGTVTVNNPDTGNKMHGQHAVHGGGGQQLPVREHRPALLGQRHRADPGADHRHDRQRDRGRARPARHRTRSP